MLRICFVLVSFSILLISCASEEKKVASLIPVGDTVKVFILKKELVRKHMNFPAELLSWEKVELLPRVSGYVKDIKVDIGDKVRKGQLLAVLEAPELKTRMELASAELETAKSTYLGSLDAFNRIEKAAATAGTIATAELEKVRNKMQADKATMAAAAAKLKITREMDGLLQLRAPFDGVITLRNADNGSLVSMGEKPLLVLENSMQLRIRVPIPETYVGATPDSGQLTFTVDALPGVNFKAKLSRKAGALDQSNRTETWEFIVPNKKGELKAGMFANTEILLGRPVESLVVPSTAIATTQEKKFVVRLRNGAYDWVDVRSGIRSGQSVEVFGNLLAGDTLVLRGSDEMLKDAKPTSVSF